MNIIKKCKLRLLSVLFALCSFYNEARALSADFYSSFNPNEINKSVYFFSSLSDQHGNATYKWDFGDGSAVSTDMFTSHVYTTAGKYTITLTVKDIKDSVTVTKVDYVTIFNVRADFTAFPRSGNKPLRVKFDGISNSSNILTWDWDFGDGTPIVTKGTADTFSHIYTESGFYNVKLRITTNQNTKDSIYKYSYIQVNEPFDSVIKCAGINLQGICPGGKPFLETMYTIGGVRGSGSDKTSNYSPYHDPQNPNYPNQSVYYRYDWKVLDPNNQDLLDFNCDDEPAIYIKTDNTFFSTLPKTIKVQVDIMDYATPPKYLRLKRNVTILPDMKANLENIKVCPGRPIALGKFPVAEGGTGDYYYSWSIVSGPSGAALSSTNSSNPIFTTPFTPGTWTIELSVTDKQTNCPLIKTMTVTSQNINVNAGPDKTVCVNSSNQIGVNVTGGSGSYTYLWLPSTAWLPSSGLSCSTCANPVVTLPFNDTAIDYTVLVTDNSGCIGNDIIRVTSKYSAVTADAGQDQSLCQNYNITPSGNRYIRDYDSAAVQLTANGTTTTTNNPSLSYKWSSIADPINKVTQDIIVKPYRYDTVKYYVTVTDDTTQCFAVDTVSVRVLQTPDLDGGLVEELCYGQSYDLSQGNQNTYIFHSSGGIAPFSYRWSPGIDFNDSTLARPVYTPTSKQMPIYLEVTDDNGCKSRKSAWEDVFSSRPADFYMPQKYCVNKAFWVRNKTEIIVGPIRNGNENNVTRSYLWQFPGGTPSSSTTRDALVSYSTPGTKTITLSVTTPCGTRTVSKTIEVQSSNAPADLWMQDSDLDVGNEPNNESYLGFAPEGWDNIFNSPDIWNRVNDTDAVTNPLHRVHEAPEFKNNSANNLYVRIRNKGCSTSATADLKTFWTRARTDEIWSDHWKYSWQNTTGLLTNYRPMGGEINVAGMTPATQISTFTPTSNAVVVNGINIPPIAAGMDTIIGPISWFPPDPSWYTGGSMNNGWPSLCLLARIISSSDTMFNENPGPVAVGKNVKNNNNIATKNTYVTNLNPSNCVIPFPTWKYGCYDMIKVAVQNAQSSARTVKLVLRHVSDDCDFLNFGNIRLKLSDGLWAKWILGGAQQSGFTVNNSNHTLTLVNSNIATLNNITLSENEIQDVGFTFEPTTTLPVIGIKCLYSFYQENPDPNEHTLGGMNFEIDFNQTAVNNSSQTTVTVVPQPTVQITPNPTADVVTISIANQHAGFIPSHLYITRVSDGTYIYNAPITNAMLPKALNLGGEMPGTYTVSIMSTTGSIISAQLLKQ